MSDYTKRDYALNKKSDSIVYKTAKREIIVVSKDDYVASAENVETSGEEFDKMKSISDEIFASEDKDETRRGKIEYSYDLMEFPG